MAAANGDSLALLAFKTLLAHERGSLFVDPTRLGFFNEAGTGDFVVVEKGFWTPPGMCTLVVCIKSFKPGVMASAKDVQLLAAEAKRLMRINHSYVASPLGIGCYQSDTTADVRGSIFLVEKWAGSTTLRTAINNSLRRPEQFHRFYQMCDGIRWCFQVAQGLACLHQNGIVHGDIKLENIMLTDTDDGAIENSDAILVDVKPFQHVFLSHCTRLQQLRRAREPGTEDSAKGNGGDGTGGHLPGVQKPSDDGSDLTTPAATDVSASDLGEEGGSRRGKQVTLARFSGMPDYTRPKPATTQDAVFARLSQTSTDSTRAAARSAGSRGETPIHSSSPLFAGAPGSKTANGSPLQNGSGVASKGAPGQRSFNNVMFEESPELWAGLDGLHDRLASRGVPAYRLSFDGIHVPVGAGVLQRMSSMGHGRKQAGAKAAADAIKARWIGHGRMRRRCSWDASDAIAPGLLGWCGGGHALRHQQYNALITKATAEVAAVRASGIPGALGAFLRALHTDIIAAVVSCEVPSTSENADGPERAMSANTEAALAKEAAAHALARRGSGERGSIMAGGRTHSQDTPAEGTAGAGVAAPNGTGAGAGADAPSLAVTSTGGRPGSIMSDGTKPKRKKTVRFTLPSRGLADATNRDFSLIYRAPELWSQATFAPTPASDVYSLGVVFYEVLMRRVISPEDSTQQGLEDYYRKVVKGHREPMPELWPADIKDLISAAWAQDPSQRPPAAELARRLGAVQEDLRVLTALCYPNGALPPPIINLPSCCTIC